eukprot:TRINITY_DN5772_c0_g1_i1.p1 TRINITY_DN5772_c0_g1~~TRINITY_DN5772_c0_g1_i1.p1  ORF type:complete len:611 (-),score=133.84 TRINITY_DN5772_c0_g1_i1:23-1606(-)
MRAWIESSWIVLLIALVSFYTRFENLAYPKSTVFDEVHFGRYSSLYIQGTNFFDIHPPFAKLLMAAYSEYRGYDGHYDFHSGAPIDGDFYYHLRQVPAFFGSLIAPVTYLTMRNLGGSVAASVLAAMCMLFENCLLTESRLILTDGVLLSTSALAFFGHTQVAYVLEGQEGTPRWFLWLFFTGTNIALTAATKWTGLGTMAVIGLHTLAILYYHWPNRSWAFRGVDWGARFVFLFAWPVALYIFVWLCHIWRLPFSGPGDNMYTPEYLKRLIGNTVPDDVEPISALGAIIQFHARMYQHSQAITMAHGSMSSWWSWPFLLKVMHYWGWGNSFITLMGNPAVWWGSTFALFCSILFFLHLPFRTALPHTQEKDKARYYRPLQLLLLPIELDVFSRILVLYVAWTIHLAAYLGVRRVTFLYHYLPPLHFASLAMCLLIDLVVSVRVLGLTSVTSPAATKANLYGDLPLSEVPKWVEQVRQDRAQLTRALVYLALNVLVFSLFYYFAPLAFGWTITPEERAARAWLPLWR